MIPFICRTKGYKEQRQKTIDADKKHDIAMERIANRAGLTLKELRAKSMDTKDRIIFKYRDK